MPPAGYSSSRTARHRTRGSHPGRRTGSRSGRLGCPWISPCWLVCLDIPTTNGRSRNRHARQLLVPGRYIDPLTRGVGYCPATWSLLDDLPELRQRQRHRRPVLQRVRQLAADGLSVVRRGQSAGARSSAMSAGTPWLRGPRGANRMAHRPAGAAGRVTERRLVSVLFAGPGGLHRRSRMTAIRRPSGSSWTATSRSPASVSSDTAGPSRSSSATR